MFPGVGVGTGERPYQGQRDSSRFGIDGRCLRRYDARLA